MRPKRWLILPVVALGLYPVGLPTYADSAMGGMDMSGKAAMPPQKKPMPASLSVAATVNPAAPRTGDNTLALTILDAANKPVTGLKLTASVAMTSMDMGTTHPAVTEKGGGHYTAKVTFAMDGPWRVIVRSQGSKVAVLDFMAGAKTPWKSPQIKAALKTSSAPASPATKAMPAVDKSGSMAGMDMSGSAATPSAALPKADVSPTSMDMQGMKMPATAMGKMTGIADMKTAAIPLLKETGTYTATGDENWEKQTGFGHNSGMVAMMNQMMVGGSGMEGMKMPAMKLDFGEKNYTPTEKDASAGDMAGMNMPALPAGSASALPSAMKITATMASAPRAGDNPLTIGVTDLQGKPVPGATISTTVAMTSMDMGTTHPAVTEKGAGQYAATVNFSMAGPWQVKVTVTTPGQKPQLKTFDFTAKQP